MFPIPERPQHRDRCGIFGTICIARGAKYGQTQAKARLDLR
jgi:hypothetical protein